MMIQSPKPLALSLLPQLVSGNLTGTPREEIEAQQQLTTRLCSWAALGDLPAIIKCLESLGQPYYTHLNQTDYDKRSPLHLAAAEGQLSVVKYLLEQV